MANSNIISINQLIKMFSDFSDSHLQLNDFGYGPTSEIGTSTQMEFPYLWVTHRTPSTINVTNKTQIPQLTLTFLVVDQINIQKNIEDTNGLDSDNSQEIVSDTFQIAQDLVTYMSVSLGRYGVQLTEDSISIEPVFDQTPDKVTGWILDVNLNLKHTNCVYPTDGLAPIAPNTCSPVIVRNSDGSYSVQVASGGILDLPDVDIEINGELLATSASTQNIELVVKNSDGDTTGSPIDGEWIVPVGGSGSLRVYYDRPELTEGVSTDIFDEAWLFANNYDPSYIIPDDAVYQKLDIDVSVDYLIYNNVWGHKFRLTGENGGYYDFNDSQYKDVDGNLSTFLDEFSIPSSGVNATDGLIIDHLTGLSWRSIRGGASDWATAISSVASSTVYGYTNWRMPPATYLLTIADWGNPNWLSPATRAPFQYNQSTTWACTNMASNPTGGAFFINSVTGLGIASKTGAVNKTFHRIHYLRSEYVTQ